MCLLQRVSDLVIVIKISDYPDTGSAPTTLVSINTLSSRYHGQYHCPPGIMVSILVLQVSWSSQYPCTPGIMVSIIVLQQVSLMTEVSEAQSRITQWVARSTLTEHYKLCTLNSYDWLSIVSMLSTVSTVSTVSMVSLIDEYQLPWCDEWHPVIGTPVITHHSTRESKVFFIFYLIFFIIFFIISSSSSACLISTDEKTTVM